MKKIIIPLLLTFLVFSGCKKEDDHVQSNQEKLGFLQNKNWKVISLTVESLAGTEDIYNTWWESCNRDDYYRFNSAGAFLFDEGPTKCNSWDDQAIDGHWDYDQTNNKVHFYLGSAASASDHYYYTIQSISENAMTWIGYDTTSTEIMTETWNLLKQ